MNDERSHRVARHPLSIRVKSLALGVCAALLATQRTGLLAAAPAAVGLVLLGVSDGATGRFSVRTLRRSTTFVCAALVLDAARAAAWSRLLHAIAMSGALALVLTVLWALTSTFAFGDVLLVVFASLVPAWLSPHTIAVVLLSTCVLAGGVALARQRRRSMNDGTAKVPLGPALAAAWMIGTCA